MAKHVIRLLGWLVGWSHGWWGNPPWYFSFSHYDVTVTRHSTMCARARAIALVNLTDIVHERANE